MLNFLQRVNHEVLTEFQEAQVMVCLNLMLVHSTSLPWMMQDCKLPCLLFAVHLASTRLSQAELTVHMSESVPHA